MVVTIPRIEQHDGSPFNLATYRISDNCPICGQKRGKPYGTISWDGSMKLHCDGWRNPCGHIDKYSDVRKYGERIKRKEPRAIKPIEV